MRGEGQASLGLRCSPGSQETSLLNLDVSLRVLPQIILVPEDVITALLHFDSLGPCE